MAVSRETVLFYEPEGGAQGALLKSILVRMGVRIKNVSSEAVGQTIGCLLGRKGFDARENPEGLCWTSRCWSWTDLLISGWKSCCGR